jgi:sortase (surface protein transpeptidase)
MLQDFADWWAERTLQVRLATVGAAGVVAGLFLTAVVLIVGGSPAPAEVVVATPPPTATATVTPTSTATASPRPADPPTATPTPEAEPTDTPAALPTEAPGVPTVRSLSAFVSEYGYPRDATFARLRIPSLGVDSQVAARTVGTDGNMALPGGPADVVWYDMSAWPGMGGAPGAGGNAIFSGHVDYAAHVPYANVNYRGQGIFYQLHVLSPGDVIEVSRNGETYRYQVVWRRNVSATATGEWGEIWSNGAGVDSITLYTCGGDWDSVAREYSDRVVVRAERI